MTAMTASQYREGAMTSEERKVIFASSLGTVFEWYDFYIYGTLAPILAAQFFSGVNPTAAFIFTLLNAKFRTASLVQRGAILEAAAWLIDLMERMPLL